MNPRRPLTNKTCRRLAVAFAVAAIPFTATFALAASGSSSSVRADSGAVAACDVEPSTSYTTAYDAEVGGYEIDRVVVGGIGAGCGGSVIRALFTDATGAVVGAERSAKLAAKTPGGKLVIEFGSANVSAEAAAEIHVAVASS